LVLWRTYSVTGKLNTEDVKTRYKTTKINIAAQQATFIVLLLEFLWLQKKNPVVLNPDTRLVIVRIPSNNPREKKYLILISFVL
jgi:hypothetical protein